MSKGKGTFAVIGSADKDTKEDRFNELLSKLKSLALDGKEDGDLGRGMSFDAEKTAMFGSKLLGKHNNAKAFVFETVEPNIKGSNFSRQGSGVSRHEVLRYSK